MTDDLIKRAREDDTDPVMLQQMADTLEAQAREIARLRGMLKPQWFYLGDDQSSDQCRFSPCEVVYEDFSVGATARKKART